MVNLVSANEGSEVKADGAEDLPTPKVSLGALLTPKVSLAQQQNAVPMLLELSLTNETDEAIENIELRLSTDPAFCESKTWRIDRLMPEGQFGFTDLDLKLSRAYLASLKEAIRGDVNISVVWNEQTLAEVNMPIEILCPDEWGGLVYLPELTAAYCCPNDPAVDQVLKKAANILRDSNLDASLEGYQSKNRKRVWQLISAIYSALASFGIDYTNPPASFEKNGQKVRYPSRILDTRLATCLDLALFMAACLEQCGLNPLLFLKKEHAFVGCWLIDEDFSIVTNDDPQAIRKREKLGEMLVIESTLLTKRPAPKLATAAASGLAHLSDEDAFDYAIDIKRARMQAIKPVMVGESEKADSADGVQREDLAAIQIEEAPDLPDLEYVITKEEKPNTPQGRIDRWKRKLLDLTLRNKSLNYKATKQSVPIFCPDLGALEDLLAAGKELKFVTMPDVMSEADPRSSAIHKSRHEYDAKVRYAEEALQRNDIMADVVYGELENRLVALYRKAKNDMEEGGANTLFLAVGFLTWTQTDKAERRIKAPLLLLPVTIKRRSVKSGFRLVLHDDEPRLNPTLLEMLRQDFELTFPTLEGDLPEDHSGVDVQLIWDTVRREIRDYKGWEVTEEACVATLSFTKYLMWKDLEDRTDQLKENTVVQHLIDTPRESYLDQGQFPDAAKLDEIYSPVDTFCPMLADSSQLAAVFAAAEGKDFVLVGPPGTGKSQTITNMIVQCLAEGKKVLFVSEKMAALDVVYRRLREVGMGTFCLELHSSKARKLDVVQQLGEAWDTAGQRTAEDWEREAERLKKMRKLLNQFPKQLHKAYGNGLTPYGALSFLAGNPDVPRLDLSWSSFDCHSMDQLDALRNICKRLGINANEVGGVHDNPFEGVSRGEWSPTWQSEFELASKNLFQEIASARNTLEAFIIALTIDVSDISESKIRALQKLAEILPQAFGKEYTFAASGEVTTICRELRAAAKAGRTWSGHRDKLSTKYSPSATSLDLWKLQEDWIEAEASWWPLSFWKQITVRNELRTVTTGGRRPKTEIVVSDLKNLIAMGTQEKDIERLNSSASKVGAAWNEFETNWDELEQAANWAGNFASCLAAIADGDLDQLMSLRDQSKKLLFSGNDFLNSTGPIGMKAGAFFEAFNSLFDAVSKINEIIATETSQQDNSSSGEYLNWLTDRSEGWMQNLPKLRSWCAWRKVRDEALKSDLKLLVEALENGSVSNEEVVRVFEASYRSWWIKSVVDNDSVLCNFVSAEHERLIDEFRTLDEKFMEMTKRYVRARLCGDIPHKSQSGNRDGTEWGILNRELNKKSRHMPLRKLVGALPNVLTKLAPCQLMSPLSIAQYLNPATSPFDVVIFDEASQIPVWDAIGAIARGKQTIVVGDPKQLPPTSFFSRPGSDEEDEEIEDLESILDECIGANLPTIDLRWHYRSRHESLITFSNHRYYGGRLITFPSAVTDDIAVKYHHVPDGIYEIGTGRVNRQEARAVVDAVLAWLCNPEFIENKWTIGVVTFNSQQQSLIEDLLDEERRKNPSIEPHFAEEAIESVFVKNLENVQGDERDIIIFSVTFGPSSAGKVSMNFGPMNKDGGERRLNVAITRARQALHVFGTLRGEDIDLARTKAIGVRDFKHFLEFAERGPRALAEAIEAPGEDYDSGFEEQVAMALQGYGWRTHPQVGVSGFRIDLGIVHPDHEGSYLAGIECDGATYHRSACARDRDRLRELVLNGLGWKILRVWSTDWWVDPKGIAEKLDQKLNVLLENARNRKKQREEGIIHRDDDVEEFKKVASAEPDNLEEPQQPNFELVPEFEPENIYEIANVATAGFGNLNAEAFHDFSESRKLAPIVKFVVSVEGPILLESLATRIARAYGMKKTGAKILRRIKSIAIKQCMSHREQGSIYFWPEGKGPDDYEDFRVAKPGQAVIRNADEISFKELANLARYIQDVEYPVDEKGLARGMAHKLGYQKMAAKLEKRLMKGIAQMRSAPDESLQNIKNI